MLDAWSSARPDVIFHDPLAAAVAFNEGLCQFEPGRVDVEVDPRSINCGRTRLTASQGEPPVHRVACQVNASDFFREYFGVVGL